MGRRLDKIDEAAEEAGNDAIAIACDATDEAVVLDRARRGRASGWAGSTR